MLYLKKFLKKSIKNKDLKKNIIPNKGGRNLYGRITVRGRGGKSSIKNSIKCLHNYWDKKNFILVSVSKMTRNSNYLGIWFNKKTFQLKYGYICNNDYLFYLKQNKLNMNTLNNDLIVSSKGVLYKNLLLKDKEITLGSKICQLGGNKIQYIRSAGTFGEIYRKKTSIYNIFKREYIIKMPSGKLKKFLNKFNFIKGRNSNILFNKKKKKKAGENRLLGLRPKVRGVAMNSVDHPHGGGRGKTSGGKPSVSFTGIYTKGVKTRKKKKLIFIWWNIE